ncbi:transmembrane protein, putative (macronuclear) [Tetrahymena thermophila SB210]|uniref:Transmembrane protein, putative n=1 Tax=Tetrahymena thermophila (strain SB210) TaxID=312017 RepID=I7M9C6_TETTS|nr:transmembrane protein, putative [Tetrahymena thermophila SB210]EAS01331.2 transmembrane protein, putative [Tetrahymena thermophila SB210]|eukprot:XP_001021576.2 transmembrane protein, putative [Tetrahymena thermophila SB210]
MHVFMNNHHKFKEQKIKIKLNYSELLQKLIIQFKYLINLYVLFNLFKLNSQQSYKQPEESLSEKGFVQFSLVDNINFNMLTHSSSRGQLLMPLLSRDTSMQELRQNVLPVYDPFKSPPDFTLVDMHAKACLVGKLEEKQDNIECCPCCNNFVNKGNMDINCSDQDLEFLGAAYPLFFKMTIYVIIFILILFFFGGSMRIMWSNWNCEDDCVRFFGYFVIMDSSKEHEQFNGMWYDLLTSLILMAAVIVIKPQIANNINDINIGFIDPASFTIAMKNLPQNTKKEDIENFFKPVLKRSKDQPKIEKINFAYSVDQYFAAFNSKISCITQINKINLKLNDNFCEESKKPKLRQQLEYQQNLLKQHEEQLEKFSKECEKEGYTENFTGTAFVTFNTQKIIKPILSEWGNSTRRSLQNFLFGCFQSPYQDFKGNKLIITKAPTPTDILWDNQKFSFFRTYLNNSLMIFVALAILFGSFYLQYIIMKIVYPFRKNASQDFGKRIQAYAMSLVVVTCNAILRLVVMYFTQLQKLDSQVRYNSAYINRYVVLLFFNSAFMPYLIHKKWDDDIQVSSNLLLQDITFLFLTNAFSEPLAKIFNVFWVHRVYMRYIIRKYEPNKCPYTQHEANYWHEGPSFFIANSYAYISRTLFLCTWYASVSPYGLLFSLIGLICNYYVDRILLLRYCSCPESQSEDIITEVVNSLPFLPIIYICGVIQFQNRSKLEVNENLFVFFGQYFEYGLTSVAMFVSFVGYLLINHLQKDKKEQFSDKFNIQYNDAISEFRTEYEKVNPITSFKANMEWTKAMNKKRANNVVGNQMTNVQNRNTRTTNYFAFGGANIRNSTLLQRNSSLGNLNAFRQRIPEVDHRLPMTSSQSNLNAFELIKFN